MRMCLCPITRGTNEWLVVGAPWPPLELVKEKVP
jgi:hypothetical protein